MTRCCHDLKVVMVGLSPVIDAGVSKVMKGEIFNPCIPADLLVDRSDMVLVDDG